MWHTTIRENIHLREEESLLRLWLHKRFCKIHYYDRTGLHYKNLWDRSRTALIHLSNKINSTKKIVHNSEEHPKYTLRPFFSFFMPKSTNKFNWSGDADCWNWIPYQWHSNVSLWRWLCIIRPRHLILCYQWQ